MVEPAWLSGARPTRAACLLEGNGIVRVVMVGPGRVPEAIPLFSAQGRADRRGGGGVDRTGRHKNGDPAFHGGLRFELGDQDRNKVVSTSLDPV
jgi:hypothetical protein